MTPQPGLDPHDTRPLDPVPGEPAPDFDAPRPTAPEPTGFVGGFRTEPAAGATPDESPEDILARPPAARDVADELAAPPRRRLPALTLALGAGVLLSAGFLAGVEVQKDHAGGGTGQGAAQQGANPFTARTAGGSQPGGGRAAAAPGGATSGAGAGSGSDLTTGTVKVVDDSFIYVSDSAGNIVKVKTDAGTKIQVTRDGRTVDLKPGDTVVVRGATGADGAVTATSVAQGTAPVGRGGAGTTGNPGTAGGAGGATGGAG
ncbi:hypothetical protein B4N89_29185 [Embleya scabrispora]|uniref:DUF5666 domain-containing protein n=1 Tax=Embleya scabrispora TaxID=159449 RepID=A0A1T3P5S8_9ACTN|nr:hypothetical protein [Embleya scabrispora]OPC84457.1 hypothetical protein B4N89_29185 [Embleya scabrispora]